MNGVVVLPGPTLDEGLSALLAEQLADGEVPS